MKLYLKHLQYLIFIAINIFSTTCPVLAVNDYTTTRVIVIEGNVICFDLPTKWAGEETISGKFIEKENEEMGWVDIETDIVLCYIPPELRDQILERLVRDTYVLIVREIRRSKPTD